MKNNREVQVIKAVLKNMYGRFCATRYHIPFTPYTHMNGARRSAFAPVLATWIPPDKPKAVIVRWFMTEWCNYRCHYCSQTHERRANKGNGHTAHAFDNFPVENWLRAFEHHFSGNRLSVVITGGESMVDRKTMVPFLNALSAMQGTECIRIDTNAWWSPELYAGLDHSKIVLMCTFHPSQTTDEAFMERIVSLQKAGFRIGMVNYVMTASQKDHFIELRSRFADIGVPLHPNPLWDSAGTYAKMDREVMRSAMPELDYAFRSNERSPLGQDCLFPALAYEMDYHGNISTGCHEDNFGSFFSASLPSLFAGPVPCPKKACACLDKYSFLVECNRNTTLDPLGIYSNELKLRFRAEHA